MADTYKKSPSSDHLQVRAASILLRGPQSPGPMINAAPMSNSILTPSLRSTTPNWGLKTLSNPPRPRSPWNHTCPLCFSSPALGLLPRGHPWKTGQERHHSVNSVTQSKDQILHWPHLFLYSSPQLKTHVHAISRRFWLMLISLENWEPMLILISQATRF